MNFPRPNLEDLDLEESLSEHEMDQVDDEVRGTVSNVGDPDILGGFLGNVLARDTVLMRGGNAKRYISKSRVNFLVKETAHRRRWSDYVQKTMPQLLRQLKR